MPIERINILQPKEFGQKVVDWSLNPTSRPADLDALKTQCAGMLQIPARITRISFVDVDLETLLVRVPNRDMVQESIDRMQALDRSVPNPPPYPPYPTAPGFYEDLGSANQPPNLDVLLMRIADYTIAQCG